MAATKTKRANREGRNEGQEGPATSEAVEAVEAVEAEGEVAEQAFELGAKEKRFLARAARFLVGIQSPSRVKVARREGYTTKEHQLGWSLYAKAAGQERSLDDYLDEAEARGDAPASAEQMQRLRELDAFENLWFPRTRALIRRVVPREERDRFAEVFFQNFEQQPLGPGVVNSVSTFLARVAGLRTSKLEGAAELQATLAGRGLTEGKLAQVRALLEQVRASDAPASAPADPRARLAAQRAQREAYDGLRDWFNDWSTTLRPVLPARDQIALGLVAVKSLPAATPDGDGGDEGSGDEDDISESGED